VACGRHFGEGAHDEEDDAAGQQVAEDHRRAHVGNVDQRIDEEAAADDPPDGDHGDVAGAQGFGEAGCGAGVNRNCGGVQD